MLSVDTDRLTVFCLQHDGHVKFSASEMISHNTSYYIIKYKCKL